VRTHTNIQPDQFSRSRLFQSTPGTSARLHFVGITLLIKLLQQRQCLILWPFDFK